MDADVRNFLVDALAKSREEMRAAMDTAAAPYLAQQRELEAAIAAVDAARSGRTAPVMQAVQHVPAHANQMSPRETTRALGMTLKDMILTVLRDQQGGMDALSILDAINQRWDVGLVRTSLSPQLSRLKAEGKLNMARKQWFLAKNDETPGAPTPGASTVGLAGSPGLLKTEAATGSTPVSSTTSLFPPVHERKERE